LIILALAFAATSSAAAWVASGVPDGEFLKKRWTTEEGLPQNTVNAIVQTRDGYIWLGTFGGLVRFDGLKFTIFNTANTPALISNRIMSLYEDDEATVWIGTETGDILRYRGGTFDIFEHGNDSPRSFVKSFLVDRSGALWASGNWGVRRYENKEPDRMTLYPFDFGVTAITEDPNGVLWFATENGVARWENGALSSFAAGDENVSNGVSRIQSGPDGTIWTVNTVHARGFGIARDGRFDLIQPHVLTGGRFYIGIAVDRAGCAWFAAYEDLYKICRERPVLKYGIGDVTTNGVRSMLFDSEGNLWLGTSGDGLVRLSRKGVQTISMADGLPSDEINVVAEDAHNGVWIGSVGLAKWENGEITKMYNTRDLPGGMIHALTFDHNGDMWMGSFSGGVGRMRDGKVTTVIPEDRVPVKVIFEDSKNRIWIGRMGRGLQILENGQVTTTYTTGDGLASNDIRFLTEDRAGSLWIGTVGGLSSFGEGKFTSYTTENGLSNNFVRDIFEDSDGTLWLGTYGGGLNRFRDGKFTAITTNDGLFDDFISRILIDEQDNLWMLGNRGIFSLSRRSLNDFADGRVKSVFSNAYGVADGMLSSEGSGGNFPAGAKMRDGRLWFPTIRGVVIIDPNRQTDLAPPVYIEEARLDRGPLSLAKEVRVEPGQENLEIQYTGLNFAKPEQVRFRYKLEGLDSNWTEAGNRRVAYFPHLPPGSYKFTVIGANSDAVWSEPAVISITVVAPFWQRWWFIALVIFGVFGMIAVSYQLRLNQLENRRATQEEFSRRLINAHESERQRVAAELHDGLGQSLLVIKNRSLLGEMNSESNGQIEQFKSISDAATQAIEEVRHITYNLRPYHLNRLGLTQAIEAMIELVAESTPIKFETRTALLDDTFPEESEVVFYRIVQECINNIIKHSEATEASVEIVRKENEIIVTIGDNGRGFAPEHNTSAVSMKTKGGFGLVGLAERVRMLRGTHTIESIAGRGTTVTVKIVLPDE
jgi:signal transduction histidine kinase/ligand-binding sensor domain-containing protein